MAKFKICVYAICKNEAKFVKKWLDSVEDADYICVLDTGSSDNTEKLFKNTKVIFKKQTITPWRFDVARNESMKLIPEDTDICICLDLDEILLPGWREAIEEAWQNNTTRMHYIYNWRLDDFDKPMVSFYGEKIHKYNLYEWVNPVHEVLKIKNNYPETIVTTNKLIINHYPDLTKSRSSYLPLLELSVKENPLDDRNMHYLGREYMYYGMYEEAIATLKKHLSLKTAVWRDEKAASMRFIARSYHNLKNYEEAKKWFNKAIMEAPHLRDAYVELAFLYFNISDYPNTIKYLEEALKIPINYRTYINEVFSFDETINDLLSISYYNTNNLDKAIFNAQEALKINPHNKRIKDNLKLMLNENVEN